MGFEDHIAEKLAKAKASAGGNFIRDGKYLFVIKKVLEEDLFKGKTFIAELEVVSCERISPDVEPNPVGSTVSFVQQLEEREQTAYPNTKAFLLAAADEQEDQITGPDFKQFYLDAKGSKQALRGVLVAAETYRKVARSSGKELTLPRFTPVKNQGEAEIATRRAKLDGAEPAKS